LNINTSVIIAIALFIISYAVIITEKMHKTIIALIGASFLIIFGVLNQDEAIKYIDFNTVGLLVGMMILVSIIKRTGLFEYIGIKLAKVSKGSPTRLLALFMVVTAVLSAFLDNVTTIIVLIPITISICKLFELKPIPFVIAEIFASNVGGTATLIGDPPNILIGSATHLSFMDFIVHLAPIAIISLIVSIVLFTLIFRKDLRQGSSQIDLSKLDLKDTIKDKKLLFKSISVTSLVIVGFLLHGALHIPTATIAITGAAILLIISKIDIEEALDDVEWTTIFFFVGLFILVGGLEETGVLEYLAYKIFTFTGGNLLLTGLSILWVSAIFSAFIDNIPFVATMIPMIKTFGELSGASNIDFLWWCLALGACFGGNGTIIGASANVMGIDLLKKHGHDISFKHFFKVAFPLTIVTIVLATIYARFVLY
jgi:anion transporter